MPKEQLNESRIYIATQQLLKRDSDRPCRPWKSSSRSAIITGWHLVLVLFALPSAYTWTRVLPSSYSCRDASATSCLFGQTGAGRSSRRRQRPSFDGDARFRSKTKQHSPKRSYDGRNDPFKSEKRPQASRSTPERPRTVPPQHNGVSSPSAFAFNKALQELTKSSRDRRVAAQRAYESLMERIAEGDPETYDTVSFNIVLRAFAEEQSVAGAQAADELLKVLLKDNKADAYSYAAVLNAYAKSGGRLRAAQRATELLTQLEQSSIVLQTDVCHNAVMNAWAVSGCPRAGPRAEQILEGLQSSTSIGPTRISYNACIKAFSRSSQPQEAQRLLEQMKQFDRVDLMPDKISYSTCIDAWARSSDENAAEQAEGLLGEMEEAFVRTEDGRIRPDVVTYTSVLAAYARSHRIGAEKAHELLTRMREHSSTPNAAFLNNWIHLLAKTATIETASTHQIIAVDMLRFMEAEFESGKVDMKPCKITYTAVISVLAQVGTVQAAKEAELLLDELLLKWRATSDDDYLPSVKTYASVLYTWAKSDAPSIDRADFLMRQMHGLYDETQADELKPNLVVFAQVFQILANSRDSSAAVRAKDLLHEMKGLSTKGYPDVRPDAATYANLINAFTKAKVDNVAEIATLVLREAEEGYAAGIGELRPTELLYSAVLQAYAKSASKEGAELAESLLARTKEMYREGKMYAKPTALFYNAVIDAQARSGGGQAAAERAEELLNEMESRSRAGDLSLRPRTRSFNAAILAWRNSDSTDAPRRAEVLLKRMNDMYKAGEEDCRPDTVTLNSIIAVWAAIGDQGAERAEEFLGFMETAYESGDSSLKPDAWTYNTCIGGYARSRRKDAATKARKLYERMRNLYEAGDKGMKPDVITLTSLRSVWSRSSDADAPRELDLIEVEIDRLRAAASNVNNVN